MKVGLYVGMTIYHKTNATKAVITSIGHNAIKIKLSKEIASKIELHLPVSNFGEFLFFDIGDIEETPLSLSRRPEYMKYGSDALRIARDKEIAKQKRLDKEVRAKREKEQVELNKRKATIDNHKTKLINKGLPYNGVMQANLKKHRVTHCYDCKGRLDNSVDIECKICDWIICSCGACGCGYG